MENNQEHLLLRFFKAVAQPERLELLGLLSRRTCTVPQLAKELSKKETIVIKHLNKLKAFELIEEETAGYLPVYRLNKTVLAHLNQIIFAEAEKAGEKNTDDTCSRQVFKHYLQDEKIKEIPENHDQLMVILRWLVNRFQEDGRYSEKEVNEMLQQHHPDYATLRRYLVDYGMMQRNSGFYWRTKVQA